MNIERIIDDGDLIMFATSIGYDHNTVVDYLAQDNLIGVPDMHNFELYQGMSEDYDFSKETSIIIEGFLKKENLQSCLLLS